MKIELAEDDLMEIQVIPLIDCVLFLLFFFLVATTMKKLDRELPLELPDSAAAVTGPVTNDALVISIDGQGKFYLDGALASNGMMHDRLRAESRTNPERKIRIDGDRAAPFESLVQVLDQCDFEGLKNVRIRARER